MATTITYLGATLTLPPDLLWRDEFEWRAVAQSKRYSLTGALIVETKAMQSGRPITLASEGAAWVRRSVLAQLHAWRLIPGATFDLVVRGEAARRVAFDQEATPIESQQINQDYDSASGDDLFTVTLRFIEVPA